MKLNHGATIASPLVCRLATVLVGLSSLGCGSGPAPAAELSAAQCSDGVDNDEDGTADCADVGCTTHTFCAADGGVAPDSSVPPDSSVAPDSAVSDSAVSDSSVAPDTAPWVDSSVDSGPADTGTPDAEVITVTAIWEFPGLVPYGVEHLFPTYLAHLFGLSAVDHPLEMETACVELAKAAGPEETVRLEVRFPGYGASATQDVHLRAGEPQRVCVNPVFDLDALYALRALTGGRIEATALDEAGRDVGTEMQVVTILPGNEIVWGHPTIDLPNMRDLSAVYATPHDPQVEALLRDVQLRSVFPGGFGGSAYGRTPYPRSHRIGVGEVTTEFFFLETGEATSWSLGRVDGGSGDDIDIYIFTAAQYEAWVAGTSTTATGVWTDQVTGATGGATATAAGWFVFVAYNTPDNFVARDVDWGRANTREDVARDALRSIFEEMAARGTTYNNILGTYFGSTQHIKRADEVLVTRSANCIDGSLLFASVLELVGMEPVVIYSTGHAYLGVRSGPGSPFVWPVETTMVGSGSFWSAYNYALDARIVDATEDPYFYEVDLASTRGSGLTPVPR